MIRIRHDFSRFRQAPSVRWNDLALAGGVLGCWVLDAFARALNLFHRLVGAKAFEHVNNLTVVRAMIELGLIHHPILQIGRKPDADLVVEARQ